MIISIFIPHGGCPERCTFCDQKVSGGSPVPVKEVVSHIEAHLKTHAVADAVAFYGGTFTALSQELQLRYLSAVKPYLEQGKIRSLRLATRPDALDRDWLLRLRDEFGLRVVELGAQSFNPLVLENLGRTHSPEDTRRGVALLRELGIETGLHVIIGGPGESESSHEDGVLLAELLRLAPDYLRIHPLLVLRGTELEKSLNNGEFHSLSLEEAIDRSARIVEVIETQSKTRVIRLGLQPNDLLGQAVVAGPYHPAFGELVRGRILRNFVTATLEDMLLSPGAAVQLEVPEKWVSALRGQKSANLLWLKEKFELSSLTVSILKEGPHVRTPVQVRIRDLHRTPERRQIQPSQ